MGVHFSLSHPWSGSEVHHAVDPQGVSKGFNRRFRGIAKRQGPRIALLLYGFRIRQLLKFVVTRPLIKYGYAIPGMKQMRRKLFPKLPRTAPNAAYLA
jgi:hypothetical protein